MIRIFTLQSHQSASVSHVTNWNPLKPLFILSETFMSFQNKLLSFFLVSSKEDILKNVSAVFDHLMKVIEVKQY